MTVICGSRSKFAKIGPSGPMSLKEAIPIKCIATRKLTKLLNIFMEVFDSFDNGSALICYVRFVVLHVSFSSTMCFVGDCV